MVFAEADAIEADPVRPGAHFERRRVDGFGRRAKRRRAHIETDHELHDGSPRIMPPT
jgi:hypothetical protein